ncbi:hypothetical protein NPX13_g2098 [Xylaria arbuscula]|uniref:NADH:ubiquinone oxidoreductase intermediate-associated protein 30 domain-containing protein n=1 Tax=Xylaria arbuscula TaxID=114810 RepID=A0A9W8TPH5_9PEZI|nr:hypothetical protein NPX13_g2098 [Xylaria arbuscula]
MFVAKEPPQPKEPTQALVADNVRPIFGASKPWKADSWEALDIGNATSCLSPLPDTTTGVRFHGTLDLDPVGLVTCASRASPINHRWDFKRSTSLRLILGNGDGRTYALRIVDSVPYFFSDQQTVEWQYIFVGRAGCLEIPCNDVSQDGSFSLDIMGIADVVGPR